MQRTGLLVVMAIGVLSCSAPHAIAFDVGSLVGAGKASAEAELGKMSGRFAYMLKKCDTDVTADTVSSQIAKYGLATYGEKPDMEKVGEYSATELAKLSVTSPSCDQLAKEWARIAATP